ncbi:MAG: hypothetical protein ABL932_24530, partial [Terricaulis sp.]
TGESAIVSLDDRDAPYRRNMAFAFFTALLPATFPAQDIENADDPCTRGQFEANSQVYHAFGEGFASVPRWAVGDDPQRIVYLAMMPPPNVVQGWFDNGIQQGPLTFRGPAYFVLAITNGDSRDIYAVFDAMPGDAQLLGVFRDALEGRLPRIAVFDAITGETRFAERQTL